MRRITSLGIMLTFAALVQPGKLAAEPVAVRHMEGLVHGFLQLRSVEGSPLAYGDLVQVAHGDRVTNHLVFRFKDGSVRDETAVYSQRGNFLLQRYHLVQNGPAFQHPMDASIDCSSGQVTVRYNDDGKEKVATERLQLPPDVANGMILTLLKNLPPDGPPASLSMVAFTPEPRLVKLAISAAGEEPFWAAGASRKAMHYVLKVEIGGLTGAIAPLLGNQPPDEHFWILRGEAPAFIKSEGPLAMGGPIWRIEPASPVWSRSVSANSRRPRKLVPEK
jgi:hypothetical protein